MFIACPDNDEGQSIVEYAFILALVALIIVVLLAVYGRSVYDIYEQAIPKLLDAFNL